MANFVSWGGANFVSWGGDSVPSGRRMLRTRRKTMEAERSSAWPAAASPHSGSTPWNLARRSAGVGLGSDMALDRGSSEQNYSYMSGGTSLLAFLLG